MLYIYNYIIQYLHRRLWTLAVCAGCLGLASGCARRWSIMHTACQVYVGRANFASQYHGTADFWLLGAGYRQDLSIWPFKVNLCHVNSINFFSPTHLFCLFSFCYLTAGCPWSTVIDVPLQDESQQSRSSGEARPSQRCKLKQFLLLWAFGAQSGALLPGLIGATPHQVTIAASSVAKYGNHRYSYVIIGSAGIPEWA